MRTSRPTPPGSAGAYTVKALVKALRILECLAEDEQTTFTLTELSRRLHLHVSTVHRLMVNLLRQGFVELDPATGGYQLGFRVLRMGLRVLDRLDYRRVAHPLLRELNLQTQETVHLAILQGDRAISIEKFGSPQPVGLDPRLGGQMPLYCTGVGKVLLAFQRDEALAEMLRSLPLDRRTQHTITALPQLKKELSKIREQGYAFDQEEAVVGLRCVAAPLLDHLGRVVAAFSVAGPSTRLTDARIEELTGLVRETSREISHRLGYSLPASSPTQAKVD
ncbi:MAG: IclR family transcriptional regulator [Acidobacteriia bacterium]|nr:IclR family transcriptional regulator [Terriglobia bacterium]